MTWVRHVRDLITDPFMCQMRDERSNQILYPIGSMNTKNTLTQASKNGRKPYSFPQKKYVSMFYAINLPNTIDHLKPTNFNCA